MSRYGGTGVKPRQDRNKNFDKFIRAAKLKGEVRNNEASLKTDLGAIYFALEGLSIRAIPTFLVVTMMRANSRRFFTTVQELAKFRIP